MQQHGGGRPPTVSPYPAGPYAGSKLALSLWSHAAAGELAGEGVSIVSADPGGNLTDMTRGAGMPLPLLWLARLVFRSPDHGAGLLMAAASAAVPSGTLLVRGRPVTLPFGDQAEQTLRIVSGAAEPGEARRLDAA